MSTRVGSVSKRPTSLPEPVICTTGTHCTMLPPCFHSIFPASGGLILPKSMNFVVDYRRRSRLDSHFTSRVTSPAQRLEDNSAVLTQRVVGDHARRMVEPRLLSPGVSHVGFSRASHPGAAGNSTLSKPSPPSPLGPDRRFEMITAAITTATIARRPLRRRHRAVRATAGGFAAVGGGGAACGRVGATGVDDACMTALGPGGVGGVGGGGRIGRPGAIQAHDQNWPRCSLDPDPRARRAGRRRRSGRSGRPVQEPSRSWSEMPMPWPPGRRPPMAASSPPSRWATAVPTLAKNSVSV